MRGSVAFYFFGTRPPLALAEGPALLFFLHYDARLIFADLDQRFAANPNYHFPETPFGAAPLGEPTRARLL